MTPVSLHFSLEEFACHDGSAYPDEWIGERLTPLCQVLEAIRGAGGNLPIRIDSGYRSIAYDDKLYQAHVARVGDDGDVAPASRSQHPQGRAADIVHPSIGPVAFFNLILKLYEDGTIPQLGGVGLYPSFVHVDVRPHDGHLAIWGGARPSNIA
jgi:uncharacterized protein YcbK (DUF882 family)